jgi:hypothetical protein
MPTLCGYEDNQWNFDHSKNGARPAKPKEQGKYLIQYDMKKVGVMDKN